MKFELFFLSTRHFLQERDCAFYYQRKNCKKHGHFKKKLNRSTGEVHYEIRIERNDNDAAKIYTYTHELAHMLNDHLDSKELTYPQKEWVADQVAKNIINDLGLYQYLEESSLNKKFNINMYSRNWMKNRQISTRKLEIMEKQLISTTILIKKSYINLNI